MHSTTCPPLHNVPGIGSIHELDMVREQQADVLRTELNARWNLLEGAFLFAAGDLPMT